MSRIFLKCFSFVIALCLILCTLSCQAEPTDPPVQPPEEELPTSGEETPTHVQLSAKYILIRPEERRDQEVEAIQLLWRALGSVCGEVFRMETDYLGRDNESDEGETYEILIGATNRSQSQEVLASLSYSDWAYRVVDEHRIVICGGSPDATYAAVCAFLREHFGYEENAETGEVISAGANAALPIGTAFDYRHQYAISSLTLAGTELSEYSLVLSTKNGTREAAQEIVDHFVGLTGVELPILTLNAYKKGEGGPAIFLGCANADDKHLDISPYSGERYFILDNGDHIVIDFKDSDVAMTAARRFVQACMPRDATADTLEITLPTEAVMTGLHIPEGTNALVLDTVERTEIAAGVVYEARCYHDANGKPVRAYLITVAKGAAAIATGLPGDKPKIGTYDTVLDQVKAAAQNGKNVVAGVNADFFGNTMLGVCVREGVELHDVSGRPWFGVTEDGTPVLGRAEEYDRYKGKLISAVGGSNVIIDEGYVSHISVDDEFGYVRHPRTAVGITPDDSTVLLVVDGRQPSISNGASLADLADILGSLGCIEAINLDGGGSSTFVLAEESGSFAVKNSPSDGSLRETANGLMVVLP